MRKPALHLALALTFSLLALYSAVSVVTQLRTRRLLARLQSSLRDQDRRLADLGRSLEQAREAQSQDLEAGIRRVLAVRERETPGRRDPPGLEAARPLESMPREVIPLDAVQIEPVPLEVAAGDLAKAEAPEAVPIQTAAADPGVGPPESLLPAAQAQGRDPADNALAQPDPPASAGDDGAPPGTPPGAPPSAPPESGLAEAVRCYQDGRYAPAAARFSAILALEPGNIEARRYHALSLYRANPGASARYAEIERDLLRAVQEQPDCAEVLDVLGILLAEGGRWREATERFGQALRLEPENSGYLRRAGLCALYAGDLEAAERYFLRVCSRGEEDAELWFFLAEARSRGGKLEAALEGYRRCLVLDPGCREARLKAEQLSLALGSAEENLPEDGP